MRIIPKKCTAIQLTGPGELKLNEDKPVPVPEGHQILCKVLVVGLCFSDMKLLKQFSSHARKSPVQSGADPDILAGLPSYVPGEKATVPGHETVVEIFAVGEDVSEYGPGERYVVQADWRWLKTRESNGAFGYNFEGGLQEYVLVDERLISSPGGEPMFLPIDTEKISLSAFALVEPWACVEESYQSRERGSIKKSGNLLIVVDTERNHAGEKISSWADNPERVTTIDIASVGAMSLLELPDEDFDDIIYIGANADHLEILFKKAAKECLINISTCGDQFQRAVNTPLGDIHYRGIRITGTSGSDPAGGYKRIPPTAEIRPNDRIHIVGAGGPMGVMHVMRNLCQGITGIEVVAADLSRERLAELRTLAEPVAIQRELKYSAYSPLDSSPDGKFDYTIIMAPIPALCSQAVDQSSTSSIINIFAGIPAGQGGEIDMNKYISHDLYFIGTSGSVMEDMKIVKQKVESGQLDTNVSVAAISGLDGAIEGLHAVDNQDVPGKILVYPECKGLVLTRLTDLADQLPNIYGDFKNDIWSKSDEAKLLKSYRS